MKAYVVIVDIIYETEGAVGDLDTFRVLRSPDRGLSGYVANSADWFVTKDAAFYRVETFFKRKIKECEQKILDLDKKDTVSLEYYSDIINQCKTSAAQCRDMNDSYIRKLNK